jgi:hypothetical protein
VLAVLAGGCVAGVRTEREIAFAEVTEFAEIEMQAEPAPPPPVKAIPFDQPGVGVDAPPFVVTSDLGEIEVQSYEICWDGPNSGMCAGGQPAPDRALIAAAQRLTIAFEPADQFTAALSPTVDGERVDLAWTAVDGGWDLDLSGVEPGDHVLWLDWTGPQGDSHAALTLRVMPAG